MAQEPGEKIKVLIVDDVHDTRENLRKLLNFETDIEVVGAASGGQEALELSRELHPDIVLMDINMPDMDGISAAESIVQDSPATQIIMMSVQGETDYLRRSMLAGAREFLTKPFSSEELVTAIRRVYRLKPKIQPQPIIQEGPVIQRIERAVEPQRMGHIIGIYSPKGGVGCSMIAANLAVALSDEGKEKVVLVDTSLQFGDLGVLLNLQPLRSIADLVPQIEEMDEALLDEFMQAHSSGIKVLLAPPKPEMADLVTADHVKRILSCLKGSYDYIVVDTWSSLHDITLTVIEACDTVVLVITPEIPAIKNAKLFFEVVEALGYPANKVSIVLNRVNRHSSIREENIVSSIKHPVAAHISEDELATVAAANQGVPLLIGYKNRPIAREIVALAAKLKGELTMAKEPTGRQVGTSKGLVGRLIRPETK